MNENEIAKVVVDACYQIHVTLGPGLLETVYEVVLQKELQSRGLTARRQVSVPIAWSDIVVDEGFRADLVVNDLVVVELKSVEKLPPVCRKQLLTYLRLMDKRLGLLVNFGEELMKTGIKRVVNCLEGDERAGPDILQDANQ